MENRTSASFQDNPQRGSAATDTGERAGKLFIVGLAGSLATLLLLAWLARQVLAGDTMAFDLRVRELVHAQASPSLTAVMRFFTAIGANGWLVLIGATAFLAFWSEGWKREAVLLVITMTGAVALDSALKYAFGRPRPAVSFFETPIPASPSFPSGHALFSVCCFGVLAALISARVQRRPIRVALWAAAVLIAAAIGLSRIYLGVHYASDVIAGYAAAIVWISVVAHAERLMLRRRRRRRPPQVPA